MKKIIYLLGIISILSVIISCSDTNNNTNNNTNTNTNGSDDNNPSEINNSSSSSSGGENSSTQSDSEKPKTDAEIAFEATEYALNGISDIAERLRVKDSIRQSDKGTMYAFQIGIKMKESDANDVYKKLIDANISSIYVFKAGRKEYYIVQFQAKGEEELNLLLGDFKFSLGELGTEGLKVINLNDFCSRRQTVTRYTTGKNADEVKCLQCD